MSQTDLFKSLLQPPVRKLKRITDPLSEDLQVTENAPDIEALRPNSERGFIERARQFPRDFPSRLIEEGAVLNRLAREEEARLARDSDARMARDAEVEVPRFEEPVPRSIREDIVRMESEEPPLSLADQQRLAEEEEPHWSQPDENRWAQEENEALVAQAEAAKRLAREEELARREREQTEMRIAREEAARLAREQELARLAKLKEESARLAEEQEKFARLAKQQEESARLAKEQEESARLAEEQEESARLAEEQEESARLAEEQEESARLAKQQEEAARLAEEQEEAARLAKQQEEAARLAKQQEEAARLAKQQEEAARLARQQEEAARLAKQREEAARLAKQQEDASRFLKEQEEASRLAREKVEAARMAKAKADEEIQLARETALKHVSQEANAREQQKAALSPVASVSYQNDAPPSEPETDPGGGEVRRLKRAEQVETIPMTEEPGPFVSSFVPSASQLPRQSPSPSRPNPSVSPQLVERPPTLALAPVVDDEQLLDEESFERRKKLLERKKELAQKEIEVARKQRQLLKEQAKVSRNEEFNLGAWLAGAGTADLRECSDSERQKVCAIGYTVLVPTIFSLLSASYAASTLTTNPYVVGLVAVAWAIIILLVDRAIIATYSPNMSLVGKAGTIILRLVVAMLMGMTVSHPLTLLIFKDTINVHIEEQRDQEISAAREKFAQQKKGLEQKVAEAQAEVERQRVLYNQSFDAKVENSGEGVAKAAAAGSLTAEEQVLLKQRTDDAAKPFQQELANLETSLKAAEARRAQLQTEMDDWQRQYEAEIGGARSGVSGIGPRARSIEADQLSWRRADLQRLREEVATLSTRRSEIQKSMTAAGDALRREMETTAADRGMKARQEGERLAGLQQQLQEKKLQNLVSEGDNVRKGLQKAIDSGLEELNRRRKELDELTSLELKRMDDLRNNPRRDMLTQTLVMHKMFEHPEAGGHFALAAYMVLAILFLAIDTMPILVKFTAKKGEYDARRERALALSNIPADQRKPDSVGAHDLRKKALDYDLQEQQFRIYQMQEEALKQEEKALKQKGLVHTREKEVYEKEREAMHAKADRDAASTFKNLEIAERESERQRELAEQDRKLALAKQQAEIEKLELAAKEAEANEAKAKAHLSKLNLEVVQNDPKGLLKHQLQAAQVERGRQRFGREDGATAEMNIAAEQEPSPEVAES